MVPCALRGRWIRTWPATKVFSPEPRLASGKVFAEAICCLKAAVAAAAAAAPREREVPHAVQRAQRAADSRAARAERRHCSWWQWECVGGGGRG